MQRTPMNGAADAERWTNKKKMMMMMIQGNNNT